ncbi:stimulated by retinoic acid gene 8 protein-like [Heterodontus francisci]|uniref:stimulated by retinoic acid gene 8 protein-like n=1 Tax=Heterodontus francisci TaxID=7792 RepID=UPI00355B35DC
MESSGECTSPYTDASPSFLAMLQEVEPRVARRRLSQARHRAKLAGLFNHLRDTVCPQEDTLFSKWQVLRKAKNYILDLERKLENLLKLKEAYHLEDGHPSNLEEVKEQYINYYKEHWYSMTINTDVLNTGIISSSSAHHSEEGRVTFALGGGFICASEEDIEDSEKNKKLLTIAFGSVCKQEAALNDRRLLLNTSFAILNKEKGAPGQRVGFRDTNAVLEAFVVEVGRGEMPRSHRKPGVPQEQHVEGFGSGGQEVNSRCLYPRTWQQCHKKSNDLTQVVKVIYSSALPVRMQQHYQTNSGPHHKTSKNIPDDLASANLPGKTRVALWQWLREYRGLPAESDLKPVCSQSPVKSSADLIEFEGYLNFYKETVDLLVENRIVSMEQITLPIVSKAVSHLWQDMSGEKKAAIFKKCSQRVCLSPGEQITLQIPLQMDCTLRDRALDSQGASGSSESNHDEMLFEDAFDLASGFLVKPELNMLTGIKRESSSIFTHCSSENPEETCMLYKQIINFVMARSGTVTHHSQDEEACK